MLVEIPNHLRIIREDKSIFSRKEAADYLTRHGRPTSPRALADMAANHNAGGGPAFNRYGAKKVVYERRDLDEWLERTRRRVE